MDAANAVMATHGTSWDYGSVCNVLCELLNCINIKNENIIKVTFSGIL